MSRTFITLALLILWASCACARDSFDIQNLTPQLGLKIRCSFIYSELSAAAIGDVNDDQIGDFAVAASYPNSIDSIVAVLYGGNAAIADVDICTMADVTLGFIIKGAPSDMLNQVQPMGDLNNDGIPDIAIQAKNSNNRAGRIYIVYLPALQGRLAEYEMADLNRYSVTGPNPMMHGPPLGSYYFFKGNDVNGDQLNDIFVGATKISPNSFFLLGKKDANGDVETTQVTSSQSIEVKFENGDTLEMFQLCGDYDNDGKVDYITYRSSPGSNQVVLYNGKDLGTTSLSSIELTSANTFTFDLGTYSLYNSMHCTDLDQDGKPELIIVLEDLKSTVIYGSAFNAYTSIDSITSSIGFRFVQTTASDYFGFILKSTTGWQAKNGSSLIFADEDTSAIYVVYSSSSTYGASSELDELNVDDMNAAQGFKIFNSDKSNSGFGDSVEVTVDVSGDGIPDLFVSGRDNLSKGVVYLIYGMCESEDHCCPVGMEWIDKKCVCAGDQELIDGKCICPVTGQEFIDGSCSCPVDQEVTDGKCSCSVTGQELIDGNCSCPAGQEVIDGKCSCSVTGQEVIDGECSCPITGQEIIEGSCSCPVGQEVIDGKCSCPVTGQELIEGNCSCPAGQEVIDTKCGCSVTGQDLIEGSCSCPVGQEVIDGKCSCPVTGQELIDGSCSCPTGQEVIDAKCSCSVTGQEFIDGSCSCPTGQEVVDGKCSCPVTGQEFIDGSCSCPTDQEVIDAKCSCPVTGQELSNGNCSCPNNQQVVDGKCACPIAGQEIIEGKCQVPIVKEEVVVASSSGLSGGQIAGAVVGSVAGATVLGVAGLLIVKKLVLTGAVAGKAGAVALPQTPALTVAV